MSDMMNRYDAPAFTERPKAAGQRALTDAMLDHLKAAAPWLRFVGVLGIVYAGITVAAGVAFFAIPAAEILMGFAAGLDFFYDLFAWTGAWWGTVYVAMGFFIFLPSLFTYRFGEKIRSYAKTGSDRDLELAFRSNKSLWKFYGVVYIVGLAIFALSVAVLVLSAVVLGDYFF